MQQLVHQLGVISSPTKGRLPILTVVETSSPSPAATTCNLELNLLKLGFVVAVSAVVFGQYQRRDLRRLMETATMIIMMVVVVESS